MYHAVGTTRLTNHYAFGIKRQLKPNSSPPHSKEKTKKKQLEVIHTTLGRTWMVEHDTTG